MNTYFSSFIDLFFPKTCIHTGEKIPHDSEIPLSFSAESLLTRANIEDLINPDMERKFKGLFPYKNLLASFIFVEGGVCQKLVHLAKYKGQTDIFNHYARRFGNEIKNNIYGTPDVVVPIPNHFFKRVKKGYNQAEILSQSLATTLNIKHNSRVLKKAPDFSSQTKKNKLDRLKRLSSLYSANKTEDLKGKHVLLVDDVITSGATIETCADLLLKAGAKEVSIYCFGVVQ